MVDMSAKSLTMPKLREYAASRGLDFDKLVHDASIALAFSGRIVQCSPTMQEIRDLIDDDDRALKGVNT